ncbi:MAG: protein kinase [Polyangiaceae bacterium]|nr:protein kinase [Polyangiaceae bacterium]
MQLAPGERVDRFELESVLGEGGQGQVWKARDPLEPGLHRALKLIPLALTRGSLLERARREAHALAKLEHPSLVACHGLFEDLKKDVLGLVMEFVAGMALSSASVDPRFTERHARAALTQVADALAYLHDRGVVHRDVKLENVLVRNDFWDTPELPGTVKLVDLGIAIDAGTNTRLTREGGLVGTLSYLAPEALDPGSFDGSTTDPKLDVFAFGVLATRLITRTHPAGIALDATPFVFADTYRNLAREGRKLPLVSQPEPLGSLLAGALALAPAERLPNGEAIARGMRAVSSVILSSGPDANVADASAFGDTAAASTRLSGVAARAQARTVEPPPAPGAALAAVEPEAPRSSRATVAVVATMALLLGALLTLLYWKPAPDPVPEPTASPPQPRTVPQPTTSGQPTPAEPLDAQSAPPVDAEADAASSGLPLGCEAVCDCCPSGHGCGAQGCGAALPDDERFRLRLGGVERVQGGPLATVHPSARVCVETSTSSECLGPADAGTSPRGLSLTGRELTRGTLRIRVEQEIPGADVWSLMATHSLDLTTGVTREALCKGLVLEGLEGHVPVGKLVLYLDPDSDEVPERCP